MRIAAGVIGFFIAMLVASAYLCIQLRYFPVQDDPVLMEWRSEQLKADCVGIMFLLGFTLAGYVLHAIGNETDAREFATQSRQFKPVMNFVGGAMVAGHRAIGLSRGVQLSLLDYALLGLGLFALVVAGYRVWQLGKASTEYDRTHYH